MIVKSARLSCESIMKEFPQLLIECLGSPQQEFCGVSSAQDPVTGSLIFLNTAEALKLGLASSAAACVVSKKLKAEAEVARGTKTILLSPNVELAMAMVVRAHCLSTPYRNPDAHGIHPTAVIHASAELAADVQVGAHAVISQGVKIGKGTAIGANSVIEADVQIGEDTTIHPLVYIGHSCEIGQRCEVHPHSVIGKEGYGYAHDDKGNHYRIPHMGRVVLEDDVHIGGGCTLDRGTFGETRIGRGTKFDNQCHIAHNCKIGRNGLITAGFAMGGSSSIGNNFIAGGQSVITGHIKVGDNVHIAALSGIAKDHSEPGQFGGVPLMPISQFIKMKAALVQLPEMRRQLAKIVKKVFPEEGL